MCVRLLGRTINLRMAILNFPVERSFEIYWRLGCAEKLTVRMYRNYFDCNRLPSEFLSLSLSLSLFLSALVVFQTIGICINIRSTPITNKKKSY